MPEQSFKPQMCPHCGSMNSRKLGDCSVCHRSVCEHCGNVQHSGGARSATHRECLKKADDHFSMIRFVK